MTNSFSIGDLITNGSQAGKVQAQVARDPQWNSAGVRIANIALERFGGNAGMTQFVPDHLLGSWRKIVVGQAYPVTGTAGRVTETFNWSADYGQLRRDVAAA